MATQNKKRVSKGILQYVLIGLIVVAAGALIVRSITGQDSRAEREQRAQEKDKKVLDSQRAGDPNDFARRIAEQQARAKDLTERDRSTQASQPSFPQASPPSPATTGVVLTAPSAPAGVSKPPYPGSPVPGYPVATKPGDASVGPSGQAMPGQPAAKSAAASREAAELDDAERKRALLGIRSSKIAAFEDDDSQRAGATGKSSVSKEAEAEIAKLQAMAANLNQGDPGLEAIKSKIMAKLQAGEGAEGATPPPGGPTGAGGGGGASFKSQDESSNQFLQKAQGSASRSAKAAADSAQGFPVLSPTAATSPFTLHQGSLIPVVLLSDINSDLPGEVRAMVTRNVYDSIDLARVVVPRGATILAPYNSETVPGQERVLIAGARMIFPNGASISLANSVANDRQGNSGMKADVDNRFWKIFGTSFLIAGLAKAAAPKAADSSAVNINLSGQASATAASVLADTTKRLLDRNQNIKPTLRLFKGEPFNFVVAQDMVLPPSTVLKRSF
jgi:type IV secretory pathway VirB10-like protein